MRRSVLALCIGAAIACADEPVRRGPRRAPDKAVLYGDPGLLPTREGEQARREAARAGELQAALEMLHGVERARVDLELSDPPRAAIVLRLRQAQPQDDLLAAAHRVAAAILGPDAAASTVIEVSAPADRSRAPDDDSGPTWPIIVAVLGLGFSLGLTFDRTRRAVLRRRRRRRA